MSKMHVFTALLLTAALLLTGTCGALAAKVDVSAAPKLKITGPDEAVNTASTQTLIFTPTVPGFLTARLMDPYGGEALSICKNYELHTKDNEVSIVLRDASGTPLMPGLYTLTATMISQFNVPSDEVSFPLEVKLTSDLEARAAVGFDAAGNYVGNPDVPTSTTNVGAGTTAGAATGATENAALPVPVGTQTADTPGGYNLDTTGGYNLNTTGGYNLDTTGGYNLGTSTAPLPVPGEVSSFGTTAVSVPTSSGVSYTAGYGSIGDEGLYIGVGVTDVAQQPDAGYWGLSASASDEEIWAALIKDMVSVDVDEKESAYIYDSVAKSQKRIGTVSGLSQGLNVLYDRGDGWTLVEAFRNEDGAFVRGYMRSSRLRTVQPNQTYGIVIDKATQTLTVYRAGQRVGSCQVTTGIPTANYLQRETPAGEYITATRRGTTEYANGKGYSLYTVRFSGNYHLCELPTTKRNGSDFSLLQSSLGTKASRGNVTLPHQPSTDGGINAKWIWDMTDSNKKVKILIFDDKPRSDVPVGA